MEDVPNKGTRGVGAFQPTRSVRTTECKMRDASDDIKIEFPLMNQTNSYRPDIDGLRAVAVAAVVTFHAFPSLLPAGFIGVDIFFVISGYLITAIIIKGLDSGSFSFTDFYARRIKRIFPALILVLVTCFVAGWYLLLPDEYKEFGKHLAGGAGFVSNFVLLTERGYFDLAAETKPLLHLWSLGIEEQFYFFWPLALWLAWSLRANVFTLTLVVCFLSFRWNLDQVAGDPTAVFYMPQTRVWELLIGSALSYVQIRYGKWYPALARVTDATVGRVLFAAPRRESGTLLGNLLSLIGFAMLSYGLWRITKETAFPGKAALAPSLGAACIIAGGPKALINRYILASKPLVWIGLISYPLYLWHWPLLVFPRVIEGAAVSVTFRVGLVFAAVVLAALTYQLLEKPIRRSSSWFKTPALAMSMAAVGVVGYATFFNEGWRGRPFVQESIAVNEQFGGPVWKYATNDACMKRYPIQGVEKFGWWFCSANSEKAPTLLLLGNSYANHLYPGMVHQKQIGQNDILSIGTCEIDVTWPASYLAHQTFHPCAGDRWYRQKQLIDGIVKNSGSIRYAIIDGLQRTQTPQTIGEILKKIDFLEQNNVHVIVFKPHLRHMDRDLKECFARPLKAPKEDCTISLDERKKLDDGFQPFLDELAKSHPRVKVFDQNDAICGPENCSFVIDGMPVFRDTYSHYTEFESNRVAELFATWAVTNAPGILEGGGAGSVPSLVSSGAGRASATTMR